MIDSGYYSSRATNEDTPTINNQQVINFVSEGTHNNMQQAMDDVTKKLTAHLGRLNSTYGNNPKVVSVSHSSGYTEITRFYASLVAVISV